MGSQHKPDGLNKVSGEDKPGEECYLCSVW